MNKQLLLISLLITNPLFCTHSEQKPSRVKPFIYGTAFGLTAGAGLYFASRGKIKMPQRKFFTFPWNRQQEELKALKAQLEKLSQQHTTLGNDLTMLKKNSAVNSEILGKQRESVKKLLTKTGRIENAAHTIQEDVAIIKEQADKIGRIEDYTRDLHGVMLKLMKLLQKNQGPLRTFFDSWFSSPRQPITPEDPKTLPKLRQKHQKKPF